MAAPPAKSRVIFVHRNGEPVRSGEKTPDKGLRMVLHPVKMRDFEQLKSEMTARVQLVTGAVRRVYDRQGVEITALEDFQDQGHYIACGGEKLKAESLAEGASPKKGTLAPTGGASTPSRAPLHRDNTPEKGKILWFYRNGDRHHSGAKFVVHSKRYKRFDQLLTDLSLKVTLPTGAVRRLVTPSGELITELDQLQEGQKYIACGGEKFDPDNMPRAITGDASPAGGTPSKRPSLGGSSTPSGHSPAVRPSPKSIEKFGIQTEKGKVIWAYQNGDKHHKGVKLVIHAKKYKTLDQLKVQMSSQLALPTGPVQRIYAFHSLAEKPVEVKNLADFVDGGEYVVCGPEKFNKEAIPTTLLELAGKRDKLQNGGGHATSTSTTTTHSHAADDDDEDHHHTVPAAREPVAHVPEPVHHEPAPAPAVHHEPAPAPAVHVPEPAPAPAVHHEPEPEPVAHAPEPVVHQEPEPVAAADDDTF